MGYFETNDMAEEVERPIPEASAPARRHPQSRTVSWLVGVILLLSVLMIAVAIFQGKAEQAEINDLDTVSALNSYIHLLYKETQSGDVNDREPILFQISDIRTTLRSNYPDEVHSTDPAWDRFTSQMYRTGHVDRATAENLFYSTRNLASAIKDNKAQKFQQWLWLYGAGALGIVLVLLQVLRTDQENLSGSISADHERSFSSSVLDSLNEGILACDADGRLTLINHATRNLFGVDARAVPPDNWAGHFTLYSKDGATELEKSEHPLLRARAGVQIDDLDVLIINLDSGSRYCVINGRPILGPDGQALGAVIVIHDVTERRRAEQEAMRLASIVECSTDAILGLNLDGIIVSWNAAAAQLFGIDRSAAVGLHASILDDHAHQPINSVIRGLLKDNAVVSSESTFTRRDGTPVEISRTYSQIRDEDGNTVGISVTARDITVRKRAEEALKESQKRLAEAQRLARMGSWEYDHALGAFIWSDEMYRLFDFDPQKGTPAYIDILRRYHGDDVKAIRTAEERAINHGKSYELDARIVLADGTIRHCHILGEVAFDQNGTPLRLFGTVMDISERKKAEQAAKEASIALEFQKQALEEANARLESLATSDGLTGLRNRRALDALLEQEFARSSRYRAKLSLLLMDIDKFKSYNDSFGHQAGDEVLRSVSKILTKGTRESDIVARYGGEELCVVLPETPFKEAEMIAERLRKAIQQGPWDRREVTVSIGVSTFIPDMRSPEDLLLAADQALYISKAEGRNRITLAATPVDPRKAA